MQFVDTHCHLQFDAFRSREDKVLAAASHAGVKKLICVGTSVADSKVAAGLAANKKDIWAAVGAHPHEAQHFLADVNSAKKLKKLATEPRVVAIGETGLDFYRQIGSAADQEAALRSILELGSELKLPFIFHIRDAWDDFWRIYNDYKINGGVVHSFNAGPQQLDQILSRGLYVGLNGIMTFSKNLSQLEEAKRVPKDRLLLETDAPFLTPAPFRGELCEPKHIRTVAEFLAKLRGEPLEDLAKITSANAQKLFGI